MTEKTQELVVDSEAFTEGQVEVIMMMSILATIPESKREDFLREISQARLEGMQAFIECLKRYIPQDILKDYTQPI